MNCFICKGSLEDRLTTFTVDAGDCVVIVKNVPSQVCLQCGEISYTDGVVAALEKIINKARETLSEITVVNHTHYAA